MTRRPGRPRNEDSDAAIVAATLDVVADVGITNFTIDAVAVRAGVGRATIYRRWPSKEALIFHAWASLVYDPQIPDTGSLRDDLVALFSGDESNMASDLRRRVMPQLIAAAKVDPELSATFHEIINARRQPTRMIIERAVTRGELPRDCDVELAQDLLLGPIYYRMFITDDVLDPAVIDRLVDTVLAGLRAGIASSRA
jgi:AcrR family transcriptional regulator